MMADQKSPATIDEYIAGFPHDVQQLMERVRTTIRQSAPDAEERISYQIPTFDLHGKHLVYFAAYKKHIGMYPVPMGSEIEGLAAYEAGKGTARFPLDQPIPFDLITRIVEFRIRENAALAAAKGKKKPA
jgi:uncharacterized protein YdhG (YjbR/CyaY superfamily)